MRRVRFSLFSKIMLWFFLNLLLLAFVLLFVLNVDFRFRPQSSFLGYLSNRIERLSPQITDEMQDKSRAERDEVLKKYSAEYNVEFFIFDEQGKQIAGREITLPEEVAKAGLRFPGPNFPRQGFPGQGGFPQRNREWERGREGERMPNQGPPGFGGASPFFFTTTKTSPSYWSGAPIFLFNTDSPEPVRAKLIVASDSFSGHGLFFNLTPWLIIAAVIFLGSTLFWLPFVRSITKNVAQMTDAAAQIAEEEFSVRVSEKRSDELGLLGKSINHLAERLSGFVYGQKRFLGSISHELNSPLARMQFALSILENRVDDDNRAYVEDVKEEVELMSTLVSELLTYSKTGLKATETKLEKINLLPLAENVVERETTATENSGIEINIDENLEALAQPEMLSRALANIVRNAVRYAGSAGVITISAKNSGNQIKLTVADNGTGVPDAELEKLFDPFYRLESDRARESGGAGLGLAIVKSCVEACQGKVYAKNRVPNGLEVTILLKK